MSALNKNIIVLFSYLLKVQSKGYMRIYNYTIKLNYLKREFINIAINRNVKFVSHSDN